MSRYDERDDEDFTDLPRFKRRYGCRYCGSGAEPITCSQISQAGWITFVLMLLFCWPLFWIGLLMREEYYQCPDCDRRV